MAEPNSPEFFSGDYQLAWADILASMDLLQGGFRVRESYGDWQRAPLGLDGRLMLLADAV